VISALPVQLGKRSAAGFEQSEYLWAAPEPGMQTKWAKEKAWFLEKIQRSESEEGQTEIGTMYPPGTNRALGPITRPSFEAPSFDPNNKPNNPKKIQPPAKKLWSKWKRCPTRPMPRLLRRGHPLRCLYLPPHPMRPTSPTPRTRRYSNDWQHWSISSHPPRVIRFTRKYLKQHRR
jgi:hypothetical protein